MERYSIQLTQRIITLVITCIAICTASAQRLVGNAPAQVAAGEQFRLSYTINTQNVSGFRAGNIPDALEVLMGPSTSSQSSFQMVNGHTSSSSSITYTYILCATKNGSYTIPPAVINVGGQTVKSNAIHIKVAGQANRAQQGGRQGGSYDEDGEPRQMRTAGSKISGADLFIKVSANKRRVHEQEPVLLTYKVYTLVDLTQLQGKMPDLKGFHTQEVQLPQQKSFKIENINGRPYRTVTWSQYVMFPQMTGRLQIPPITFEGIVVQQNRNVDPFEAFFNGGSGYVEVKKKIQAPGLDIQVDPLPTRPAGFSGGVGRFNISAQLVSKGELKTNNPLTLRVIVSGIGNLKLIKEPVVEFPKDFDKYDAKITDKTRLTSNGVEGSMVYDFMAVPRNVGEYHIPPVSFCYYDTEKNAYKTLQTQGFNIKVAKGSGASGVSNFTGQEDVDILNKDIRYIKTDNVRQHDINDFFFGSTGYWICLFLLGIVFVSLFVVFRQRAIDNANIGKKRGKTANKVAGKRLRTAKKLMIAGRQGEFYDEVLRALWGYVGDKLNMPVESLSRENISQRLAERNVDDVTLRQFIEALDECEYERYAPGDSKGNMNKTFEAAMTAIMKIEETMKKGKKRTDGDTLSGIVAILIVLTASLTFAMPASASVTKAMADSAYARQQYQLAIQDYEQLLKEGVSAELYYNLGNAYYRTDNVTKAVLNYERARLLSPGDKDIRFNLQLAQSKTIDKITPESEMFFVTWYRSLVNLNSVDSWAGISLAALALAIVLALSYLFSSRVWMQKAGFFGAIGLLAIFVAGNVFAWQQRDSLLHRTGAIITAPAVQVKSTPAKNGTDLFIMHEGTKVDITDDSMKGWKEIKVADGKEGWIETSKMEII